MLINHQYHTWIRRTWELRPGQGITQARNLVWLLIRINRSRSVTLSRIGARFYGEAKLKGTVQRLERFLANTSIRVRDLYVPIAKQWLEAQFHHLGEIGLIMDGTKIGAGHQLLIVCLPYQKRSIPIA